MTNAPTAMIESDHSGFDPVRIQPGRAGEPTGEDNRSLTERDCGNIAMVRNCLRYQIDRISVVEQHGAGANGLHVGDDSLHYMDRSQRHKEAPWALRLLANDAMLERNRFVQITRLKATGAKARQHCITVLQSRA